MEDEKVFTAQEVEIQSSSTTSLSTQSSSEKPHKFAPLTVSQTDGPQFRRIRVPANRFTPLRTRWAEICQPIVEHMKLQIRMNRAKGQVEIRTSEFTEDSSAIQKSADFVRAFLLGFELKDAIALLRLDDLFIDSFMVTDVKPLHGEHLSRAIGRIVGQGGKTKFTIENATKTRIVMADLHIHLLGSFNNIKTAKTTIARLILGAEPSKVYSQMRLVASRHKYRF